MVLNQKPVEYHCRYESVSETKYKYCLNLIRELKINTLLGKMESELTEKGLCQRFMWIVPCPTPVPFDELQPIDGDFTASIGKSSLIVKVPVMCILHVYTIGILLVSNYQLFQQSVYAVYIIICEQYKLQPCTSIVTLIIGNYYYYSLR